jgi:hypothetical protein
MAVAPSVAKVTDIASFIGRIGQSSPVSDGDCVAPRSGERTEGGNLRGDNLGIVRVAQDIDVKKTPDIRGSEAVQQRLKISDYLARVFIADADKDCGQCSNRLVAADVRGHGIDCRDWIAGKTHDQKTDRCVPESNR